ncbi:MAG TPA: DUF6265 family protein [Tahibacter sp.]|uniref:DUF6265 family protein n=1 Tax=Tahibacter sp. TaxID=2056211 RepID=UPI002BCD2AA0|nr:DUF6265 family protein [Tahibacter sp.]HSX62174.1 DUF6265 family protein [Tahibacter sp.]
MRLIACAVLVSLTSLAARAIEPPAWLAGHWRVEDGGRVTDEVWLAPAQGLMTGMSRTHGGKKPFFEFVRIEQRGDALVYVAQPRGGPATEFRAVQVDAQTITFENAQHDFPQRIVYEYRAPDTLAARIEGLIDGRERVERWNYRRVRP